MKSRSIRKLVMGALFAALICVVTLFVKIPVPMASGAYFHAGDAFIYVAASVLGGWGGAAAAAVGSGLADVFVGATQYIPATFIIKGVMALICAQCLNKFARQRTFPGLLGTVSICGLIMMAGYFVYEWFLFGFGIALYGLPYNAVQFAASVLIALPLLRVKVLNNLVQ